MADNRTVTSGLTPTKIGFAASLCIIAMINFTGNSIVIIIIITNKFMKTPMNYLLLNLSIADIMVGLFIPTRFLFTYFVSHPDGDAGVVMCRLFTGGNFAWIGGAASISFLVAISFERYCAVIHPFSRKRKLNWIKVKYVAVSCWVFAVVFNSPYFLIVFYDTKKNFCGEQWPEGHIWLPQLYTTLWFLLGAVLPATIMFILYSRVIHRLWFVQTKYESQFNSQLAVLMSRKRVTKMVVTVSLVYCICWTPDLAMYFLHYYGVHYDFSDNNFIVYNILITCNSAVNPFIYALRSTRFRDEFKRLVLRKNRVSLAPDPVARRPSRKISELAFSAI